MNSIRLLTPIMASSNSQFAPDDREGLSPSPAADVWDEDDDDIEYEPASEDITQTEDDDDEESEFQGMAAL